jgi:hypothetical protein
VHVYWRFGITKKQVQTLFVPCVRCVQVSLFEDTNLCAIHARRVYAFVCLQVLGFSFTNVSVFGWCSTIMPKDIQLYGTYIVLAAHDACAHTCAPCSEPGEFEESALDKLICAVCLVNSCKLV